MDWVPVILLIAAIVATVFYTMRDTRALSRGWSVFLGVLRIAFLITGIVIALNPHIRSQTDTFRPSRVLLLVDTSTSMQQPVSESKPGRTQSENRAEAVQQVLKNSTLIEQLRHRHVVDVYTFDSDVSSMLHRFNKISEAEPTDDSPAVDVPKLDWESLFAEPGHVTRLGDSVDKLLVEATSPTLSGAIVISDGASNSGRDVSSARQRAKTGGIRIVSVGVGSTVPPTNLEIMKLISPTDVQMGDAFTLSALVGGQGVAGKNVTLDLFQKSPDQPEPSIVKTEAATMPESGALEIAFDLTPPDPGAYEYSVRVRLDDGSESRTEDNQADRTVNIFDRPLKVFVIAGGPMREFRYARNSLFRHPSAEVDLWLQSGEVGISQEADKLTFKFPENKETLYEYDVVIAFDADWTRLTAEQHELLSDWIANEGGGMIAVAGDVFTPDLANKDELEPIRTIYPVLLEEVSLSLGARDTSETAYPVGMTQEGTVAEFLKISEDESTDGWSDFPGVYRTYPTRGPKAGATIYAEFTDPLSRGPGGQPILIAGHRYGQGQVLYFGSPEFWRLRAQDEAYFDRIWVKSVRKAAEGRSKRGLQRNLFISDGHEFELGQTVPIRLRAVTPQFEPLVANTVTLEAYGPTGTVIVPGPELRRDKSRPTEYVGDFRPRLPGRYKFVFAVPDSADRVQFEIDVQLPRQEAASLIQDENTLKRLTEETGGGYVSLEEASKKIAALLPDRGETVVIDQQIEELWDRRWLMFFMALLLSAEWLTRKLLKLA